MKKITLIFVGCALVVSLGSGYFYHNYNVMPEDVDASSLIRIEDPNGSYIWNIESIKDKNGYLLVEGWALERGVSRGVFDVSVALLDESTRKLYAMKTVMIDRPDVAHQYGQERREGPSDSHSGFSAIVKKTAQINEIPLRVVFIEVKQEVGYLVVTDEYIGEE